MFAVVLLGLLVAPGLLSGGAGATRPLVSTPGLDPGSVSLPSALSFAGPGEAAGAANDSWPMYMANALRGSTNENDTMISASNASRLSLAWSYKTGEGVIAAAPSVTGGRVFVGSWNGDEYALNATTGTFEWKTYLGQTAVPKCAGDAPMGITSTAAVYGQALYVGGGNDSWYVLNATTGKVLWHVVVGNNSPAGGNYNWASPLIARGALYIGTSSNCDDPLIAAKLLQVSLTTHKILHEFNTSTLSDVGASIWGSPTLDASTGTVFFATGNGGQYGESVVAVNASNVSRLEGTWQVPASQALPDGDFGTTPTLLNTSAGHLLLAAANKNGLLYAFNRTDLNDGPLWTVRVALSSSNPVKGGGSISPAVFNGRWLFVAGGKTAIGGKPYNGSVRAVDPDTGAFLWQYGASAVILGALTYQNGVVIANTGDDLLVLNATTGLPIYSFDTSARIDSQATVADGRIFVDNTAGTIFSLGVGLSYPVTFRESGIAPGTQWSVTFGDALKVGRTSALVFQVGNGTYSFTVPKVHGDRPVPASGSIHVHGSQVTKAITFTDPIAPPPTVRGMTPGPLGGSAVAARSRQFPSLPSLRPAISDSAPPTDTRLGAAGSVSWPGQR